MRDKMAWIRSHCVDAALSVHHDVAKFSAATGVHFHRIWFGVDSTRFAQDHTPPPQGPNTPPAPHGLRNHYEYDLGFTGVVRADQTANWRLRIWKQAWPLLSKRGLRLYSGPPRGIHVGVAHAELNASQYVSKMRATKLWLSTTGPADLVGTRYFEVMATGTTLCVCNRMSGASAIVYESLGIKEGKHVLMFESIDEFVEVVTNYTTRPEYQARRIAIMRHAQELAMRKFSWGHVAEKVDRVLHDSVRASRAMRRNTTADGGKSRRWHFSGNSTEGGRWL